MILIISLCSQKCSYSFERTVYSQPLAVAMFEQQGKANRFAWFGKEIKIGEEIPVSKLKWNSKFMARFSGWFLFGSSKHWTEEGGSSL